MENLVNQKCDLFAFLIHGCNDLISLSLWSRKLRVSIGHSCGLVVQRSAWKSQLHAKDQGGLNIIELEIWNKTTTLKLYMEPLWKIWKLMGEMGPYLLHKKWHLDGSKDLNELLLDHESYYAIERGYRKLAQLGSNEAYEKIHQGRYVLRFERWGSKSYINKVVLRQ